MKKFAILTTAMALSVVASAQDVESFTTNNDTHGKIRSFSFFINQNNSPDIMEIEETATIIPKNEDYALINYQETQWVPASTMDQSVVQEALDYELDLRNIAFNPSDADIIVQYQVYDTNSEQSKNFLKALEKHQPDHSQKQVADLNDGAIVLYFMNAKTDDVIWEGYAYNVFKNEQTYQERQHDLRKAIDALMKKFDYDNHQSHV